MTARIDWLVVGGAVAPWEALGLVAADGRIPFFGTGIAVDPTSELGLQRLVFSDIDAQVTDIDGVSVEVRQPAAPLFADHALGVSHIDHVVIITDSLARTCGAIADITGSPLKRMREVGEIRQGFHRVGGSGGLIVEVVERAGLPEGSTSLWGFVLVVDDIDAACAALGPDVISDPRSAVQPGRSIATVRTEVGLGVPLALMSPDLR